MPSQPPMDGMTVSGRPMLEPVTIHLTVNGAQRAVSVDPASSLADVLRQELGLTALHLGCEHGVCGACNVMVDSASVRACLLLAVQAEGLDVRTLEGLTDDPRVQALTAAFRERRALQCGFCTPGLLMSALDLLQCDPAPDAETVRDALSGNICRCTGYQPIVDAVLDAAAHLRANAA